MYHGWKFDTDGRCIDMPVEPLESNYKEEIKLQVYPCQERNGVVWTYMASRHYPRSLPDLEPNIQDPDMPEDRETTVWTALRECNWLQALEGDIDTGHLAILHLGGIKPEEMEPGTFEYYTVNDWQLRFRVTDTDCGTMYGAYRPVEDEKFYWRVAQFLFPFYTLIPTGALAGGADQRKCLGAHGRRTYHVLEHYNPQHQDQGRQPPQLQSQRPAFCRHPLGTPSSNLTPPDGLAVGGWKPVSPTIISSTGKCSGPKAIPA